MKLDLRPDDLLRNADWPKRTPDLISALPESHARRSPDEFFWNEEDHPRSPKGTSDGGKFAPKDGGAQGSFVLDDEHKPKEPALPAGTVAEMVQDAEDNTESDPLTGDDLLNPGESVHKVYLLETDKGKYIIKPVDHDSPQPSDPNLGRAIEDNGTLKRDIAGSDIAKIVGYDDLVPDIGTGVVMIEGEGPTEATIAQFVPDAKTAARSPHGDVAYDERMAYFDFILGNTDRHEGNWMVTKDRKIRLIDNDMILPDYSMESGGASAPRHVKDSGGNTYTPDSGNAGNDLRGDVRLEYVKAKYGQYGHGTELVKRDMVYRWKQERPKIVKYLQDHEFSESVIDGFNQRLDFLYTNVDGRWDGVLGAFDSSRHGRENIWGH